MADGQSIGAGSLNASLMAFMTWWRDNKQERWGFEMGVMTLKIRSRTLHHQRVNNASAGPYLVVAHVPVGPFSKCHDFPHHNPEAPHIACWCKLPVCDGLGGSPTDRDFSSLPKINNNKSVQLKEGKTTSENQNFTVDGRIVVSLTAEKRTLVV